MKVYVNDILSQKENINRHMDDDMRVLKQLDSSNNGPPPLKFTQILPLDSDSE